MFDNRSNYGQNIRPFWFKIPISQQLNELVGMESLQSLRVITTRVTDAGLEAIGKLPNLKILHVTNTKVTDAGIARLKQKLPNLEVVR